MKSSFLKKTLSLLLVSVISIFSLVGCNTDGSKTKTVKKFVNADSTLNIASAEVAKTEKFTLYWDNDKKCVLLKNLADGTYWSSIPYSYYQEKDPFGVGMVRMHSPIYIEYITENNLRTAYAQVGAISNGDVVAQTVENGLRVTYYFSNEEISVPVEYILCEQGLEVRLIIDDIRENKYQIYSVSVSPFMCGAKNNTDSYLFYPSGSGTLMYVDDTGRNTRTVSEYVYGEDLTVEKFEKTSNTENIAMPVFGVKSESKALCAIINNGAECARIDAEVGNAEYGYSSVYATFVLRSSNTLVINDNQNVRRQIITTTDDIVDAEYFSVLYTPLEKNNANYVGMAKVYSDYLKNTYDIKQNNKVSDILHLEFYGGAQSTENFIGISYKKLQVATNYSQIISVLDNVTSSTNVTPSIKLSAFGKSGINIGEIAGGMTLAKNFGDFEKMKKYCEVNKVDLYVDFDVIKYSKSGVGISKLFDTATRLNGAIAKQYDFSKSSYIKAQNYYIIDREKITDVTKKLNKYLDKKSISGVSLSTLSNHSYSGFESSKGYNKYGFSEIVKSSFDGFRKNNISVMTSSAFDYAAVLSDVVVGAPTKSSEWDGFDEDIPFYEIALKGLVPLAVSPINLAIEPEKQFLKALETGSALSFSLCNEWNKDLSNEESSVLQFCLYENWENNIVEYTKKAKEWLDNVENAYIIEHKAISKDFYYTEFSNGAYIYVNYSNSPIDFELGTVNANDFICLLGGD